ncbi:hypothetical protein O1611_g10076 [Lasiodiplodia mahajangana]|uniref:Uncharacterized protein n=1 Tax=Lasiodiplodia mahajangana TaxID=1108764 RepID=A0ACC2J2A3_9PEZI|nr:hypothetical protein O1611_g10076 [Lasiodiplodia mahajangana]
MGRLKRTHNESASADFVHPYDTQEPVDVEEPKYGDGKAGIDSYLVITRRLTRPNDNFDSAKRNPKTQDFLHELEIPVEVQQWDLESVSGKGGFNQVKGLHANITYYYQKQRDIVPNEVRGRFITVYKRKDGIKPEMDIFRTDPMPFDHSCCSRRAGA